MKQLLYFCILSCLVLSFSCATDKADEIAPEEPVDTTGMGMDTTNTDTTETTVLSFKNDILPIFQNNCTNSCHNPTPGPYPWLTYADISEQIDLIIPAIEHTGPFKMPYDPNTFTPADKLPQATIDIIKKWKEEGLKNN